MKYRRVSSARVPGGGGVGAGPNAPVAAAGAPVAVCVARAAARAMRSRRCVWDGQAMGAMGLDTQREASQLRTKHKHGS